MDNTPEVIYEEARVPAYTLPDPLVTSNGEKVTRAEQWPARRAQILALFEEQMYGKTPAAAAKVSVEWEEKGAEVFGGRGMRKQARLWFEHNERRLSLDVLIYLPADQSGPIPVFVGLNFCGNHAIQEDPHIRLSQAWMSKNGGGGEDFRATDASRGIESSRWPVERILGRGYGVVTAYYGDLDPDFDDGFQNGVHPLFYQPGQSVPGPAEWGAIGAWAWGLSRVMDFLEEDTDIDSTRVAVLGHSRLGKTALWAGAQDTRFRLVISNDSGCGGAALSRRCFGETVELINRNFPHWFCKNFHQYDRSENSLPVDQHMLVALMAPRPVYIASAAEDLWADPKGEFLSAYHAAPVYRLLGTDGLAADELPPLEEQILSQIGYHIRPGKHDVTQFDWDCFMDFADLHL
jgi:hypothetical protein